MEIKIAEDVRKLGVFIAYRFIHNIKVEKSREKLREEINKVVNAVRKRYRLDELKNDPIIRAYRKFLWKMGIDPTKTRPSSEALLRRVLRGKTLPLINNIVDIGNLVSVKTRISIGIYDLDRIEGNLTFRLSRGGEEFNPIGSNKFFLRGGIVVLSDGKRIIHVYPHRDCQDTMITLNSKNAIAIGAGVPGIPKEHVFQAIELLGEYIVKFSVGEPSETVLVS